MNGVVRMAIVVAAACLAAPALAGPGGQAAAAAAAAPQGQGAPRVRLVVSVTQPMNPAIDAKKDLQTAVKRMTAAIGFVRDPESSVVKPKPRPEDTRARHLPSPAPDPVPAPAPAPASSPREGTDSATQPAAPPRTLSGGPIAEYRAAGTVSSELFDLLVADAEVSPELATERVRDQLLALKVTQFGATLESIAGRRVIPPATLNVVPKHASARSVEALELDIRDSLVKWHVVLLGTRANPEPHASLSLFVDTTECPELPARLQRGYSSRIVKAGCIE
jgi:hypothetical protein